MLCFTCALCGFCPAAAAQVEASEQEESRLPVVSVSAGRRETTSEKTRSYTADTMSTATPLSLSVRETPQAISVITRQQIDDMHLQTVADILRQAPGISATRTDSNRYSLSARGFVIDNIQFDGLSSSIIPQWNYGATDMSAAIYDRVEIVRGATGLMSGAGYPSATVNFIRKYPTPDLQASASLGMSRWNTRTANADISTPLSTDGRWKARIVAETMQGDSYVSWLDHRSRTAYGVVTGDLAPDTRLNAGIEYQRNGNHGFGSGFPLFYSDGTRTDFDRSVANNARWAQMETTSATTFLDLRHQWRNRWQLRLAYNRNDGDYAMRQVFRGGYPDRDTGLGMSATYSKYQGRRHRNEFHTELSGPFKLLGKQHELTLGWMRVDDEMHMRRQSAAGTTPAIGSFFDWRDDHIAEPAWSAQATPADDRISRQSGVYGAAHLELAHDLHAIAGGRLSNWALDQVYFGKAQQYAYSNEFTPYGGLIYDLTPDYSLYASFTSIFMPQTKRFADGSLLPPIRAHNREVGIKGTLPYQMNASAALFQSRQANLGQAVPGEIVAGTPNTPAYRTAAGAEVRGIELELAGELSPAHSISASYTRFVARDAAGNAINTAQPSTLFKFFTRYRWSDRVDVGGGIDWQNRIYQLASSPQGKTVVTQPSYAVVNLMASYRINTRLSIAANINNLFDRKYYSQIGNYSQGWWGEPRNLSLTLRASY